MMTKNQQGRGSGFAQGFLLGSLISGVIALWFTPKSGKQWQAYLLKQWAKLQKQANQKSNQLYHDAQELTNQTLKKAEQLQQDGLTYVQEQGEQLQDQLGTAKTKIKQMAS